MPMTTSQPKHVGVDRVDERTTSINVRRPISPGFLRIHHGAYIDGPFLGRRGSGVQIVTPRPGSATAVAQRFRSAAGEHGKGGKCVTD